MRANEVVEVSATKLVLWHDDNADKIPVDAEKTTIEMDGTNLTIYKNNDLTNKETYRNCQLTDISGNEFLPDTTWVRIKFTLTENGAAQTYMVCASLRAKN